MILIIINTPIIHHRCLSTEFKIDKSILIHFMERLIVVHSTGKICFMNKFFFFKLFDLLFAIKILKKNRMLFTFVTYIF